MYEISEFLGLATEFIKKQLYQQTYFKIFFFSVKNNVARKWKDKVKDWKVAIFGSPSDLDTGLGGLCSAAWDMKEHVSFLL